MAIRRIEIERFRGIKKLDWTLGNQFICLIGHGDSTKSTILDAIELALSPRWNITFDDSDFFNADTAEPIQIRVTIGDLPTTLLSNAKFGLDIRGWSLTEGLRDEPKDDTDEAVLTIELRISSSLEPSWVVLNDRNTQGRPISASDREKLGCARVGEFLDRHFSWSRGSALSRISGDGENIAAILAAASRSARLALAGVPPEQLASYHEAAKKAQEAGKKHGVNTMDLKPQLDVQATNIGVGGISLHAGAVPMRRSGLSTRRLLAIAMQREGISGGGISLIDEVEHGLEPHRLRRLLSVLRQPQDNTPKRQTLITTHSPLAIGELEPAELRIVRCSNGLTEVRGVPEDLRPLLRTFSESFLARKIVVTEGKTELGFARGLDTLWSESGSSFAYSGVALAYGGGTAAPGVAKSFAELGYKVALFVDSDRPLNPSQAELETLGIKVFSWEDQVAIEQRLFKDLPWSGVVDAVGLAFENYGEDSIRNAVAKHGGFLLNALEGPPELWPESCAAGEDVLREAIALASMKTHKGWYKRVDLAMPLAAIVQKYSSEVIDKDLGKKLTALKEWIHASE